MQALQCVAVGEVRDTSLVVVVAAAVVGVDDLIAEHRHSFGLR